MISERTAPLNLIASWCQMPELSFAVGEEDVLVLEAEACGFDARRIQEDPGGLRALFAPTLSGKLGGWHRRKTGDAQAQAEDAKDAELKNQRKVRMSRLVLPHICLGH